MPSASAMPTRRPVNDPGPIPTATRSRAAFRKSALRDGLFDERQEALGVSVRLIVLEAHDDPAALEESDGATRAAGLDGEHAHGQGL